MGLEVKSGLESGDCVILAASKRGRDRLNYLSIYLRG